MVKETVKIPMKGEIEDMTSDEDEDAAEKWNV